MHGTPDAVFPNNWFSTHDSSEPRGTKDPTPTMVLYPMKCPNRAAERRPELIKFLKSRGYTIQGKLVDMTHLEGQQKYFEGTGVLVVDRVNGVAYVSISERADKAAAEECDADSQLPFRAWFPLPHHSAHHSVSFWSPCFFQKLL